MIFSEKIKRLMLRQGLSQAALGEALGLSQRAVGLWLSGSRPHASKVQKLADYFSVPVDILLDDSAPLPGTGGALREAEKSRGLTLDEQGAIEPFKPLISSAHPLTQRIRKIHRELSQLHKQRAQNAEKEATLLHELETLLETPLNK